MTVSFFINLKEIWQIGAAFFFLVSSDFKSWVRFSEFTIIWPFFNMLYFSGYVQLLYLFLARKLMPEINKSTGSLENISVWRPAETSPFSLDSQYPIFFCCLVFCRLTLLPQECMYLWVFTSVFKWTFFMTASQVNVKR